MGLRAGVQKTFRLEIPCNSPGCSFPGQDPDSPVPHPSLPLEDFVRIRGGSRSYRGALMPPPVSVSGLGWSRAPSPSLTCRVGPGTSWFSCPSRAPDPALQPTPGARQAGDPWSLHSSHLLGARPGALPPAGNPAAQQTRPSSCQAAVANGTLSVYSADEEIAIKGG